MAVLSLLAEESMHGYRLMGEIDQRSNGAWRPSPGSIYPLLQQLADEGLVKPDDEGDRRVFSLTDEGRAAAEEAAEAKIWDARSGGQDRVDLKAAIGSLGQAAIQVARTGTPEQAKRAEAIIVDARKQLYRLLAED
ncbi:MAG: helix-turn-helix transcriptional regulator [Microthrixaceae bacterium]|nr:helix-turn-helix transcriptional regulator [Microthrixaceae bacterium]